MGRLKIARWDQYAFDDTEFDESKVHRNKSGEFASTGSGGGGAEAKEAKTEKAEPPAATSAKAHPKAAEAAYPINPIKSALTKAGYAKGKGKYNYLFTHPSGHQIEVHAANEGQKWLTGWTDLESGHTSKGPNTLAKYLATEPSKAASVPEPEASVPEPKAEPEAPKAEPIDVAGSSPPPHPMMYVHETMTKQGFAPVSQSDTTTVYANPAGDQVVLSNSTVMSGAVDWRYFPKGTTDDEPAATGMGVTNGSLEKAIAEHQKPSPQESTAPKITPPSGASTLLPVTWSHATGEVYSDKEGSQSTEEIGVNNDGSWEIWQKGEGTVAKGVGQESLNEAFEKLHPRDEHGHFIGKQGEAEPATATPTEGLGEIGPPVKMESFTFTQKDNQNKFVQEPALHYEFANGTHLIKSTETDKFEFVGDNGTPLASGDSQQELDAAFLKLESPTTSEAKVAIPDHPLISKTKQVEGDLNIGKGDETLTKSSVGFNGSIGEVYVNDTGDWKIIAFSSDYDASGTGQESLNRAFEKLANTVKPGSAAPPTKPKPGGVDDSDHKTLTDAGYKPLGDAPWGKGVYVYGKDDGSILLTKPMPNDVGLSVFKPSLQGLIDEAPYFKAILEGKTPNPGEVAVAGETAAPEVTPEPPTPTAPASLVKPVYSWNPPFKLPKKHLAYKWSADMSTYGFAPTSNASSVVLYKNQDGDKIYLNKKLKKGATKLQWAYYPSGGQSVYGSGTMDLAQAFKKTADSKAGIAAPVTTTTPTAASAKPDLPVLSTSDVSTKYQLPTGGFLFVGKNTPDWIMTSGSLQTDSGSDVASMQLALAKYGAGSPATPPQAPPEPTGPVKAPEDITDVLAHKHELGDGAVGYSDADTLAGSQEQVTFQPDGSWSIWSSDGTILEGQGQTSFNAAFEGLHPRGPDGKFAAKPGGPEAPAVKKSIEVEHFNANSSLPNELNGVEFKAWEPPDDWTTVEGQNPNIQEPDIAPGKKVRAGLLIEEPDGRVWIVKPTNAYGGYKYTFPKGSPKAGQSLQQTAIRETFEESGLKADITGFAGDYLGSTSVTRYYHAKRTGGLPSGFLKESEGVSLVPPEQLKQFLNMERDQGIADNHFGTAGAGTQPEVTIAGVSSAPGLNLASMKKIGPQKGSNYGGQYEDADGKQYYVKIPKTSEHTKNELLTAALYKLAGGPGSTFNYHRVVDNGKLGVATDWLKLDKDNIGDLSPSERKEAQNDFAIQAWLGNWDAAGADLTNIGVANGKVLPLDLGGGLRFRAQGLPKILDPSAPEWESMRNPSTNKNTSALYGEMTEAELKESANSLAAVTDAMIQKAVMENPPADVAERDKLISTLKQRRDAIVKKATPKPLDPDQMRRKIAGWNPPGKPTSAITLYKGHDYDPMNKLMRFFSDEDVQNDDSFHGKAIKEIVDWLDKGEAKEDLILWRGMPNNGDKSYVGKLRSVAKVGKHIRDDGFPSMATREEFSRGWANGGSGGKGLLLKIRVPKGAKIATVRDADQGDVEYEVLAQRNTMFKILSWDPYFAEVELVQEHLKAKK